MSFVIQIESFSCKKKHKSQWNNLVYRKLELDFKSIIMTNCWYGKVRIKLLESLAFLNKFVVNFDKI